MALPTISAQYTDEAEKAYGTVIALTKRYGAEKALTASVNHDNVPGVLKGQFLVTGAKKTLPSGNLAHAVATLAVHQPSGATTVWHVTETGRKRVVRL